MLFQPNSKFPTVRKISFVADSPINRAHQRTGERTRVSMKHEKVGFHRYLDPRKICLQGTFRGRCDSPRIRPHGLPAQSSSHTDARVSYLFAGTLRNARGSPCVPAGRREIS